MQVTPNTTNMHSISLQAEQPVRPGRRSPSCPALEFRAARGPLRFPKQTFLPKLWQHRRQQAARTSTSPHDNELARLHVWPPTWL